MKKIIGVSLVAFLFATPGTANAQTITADARVRVWVGSAKPVIGTFRSENTQSLVIDVLDRDGIEQPVTMPWTSITRLDIDRRRPTFVTALRLAVVGMAIGAIAGLASGDSKGVEFFGLRPHTAEQKARTLGCLGGTMGGVAGLIVGAQAKWVQTDSRPARATLPAPGFSLKLRF